MELRKRDRQAAVATGARRPQVFADDEGEQGIFPGSSSRYTTADEDEEYQRPIQRRRRAREEQLEDEDADIPDDEVGWASEGWWID